MAAVHATPGTHQHLFFGLRLELHPISSITSESTYLCSQKRGLHSHSLMNKKQKDMAFFESYEERTKESIHKMNARSSSHKAISPILF